MKIHDMTVTDFKSVRLRSSYSEEIGLFDCLVLLPTRQKHDSGYRCMDFCAFLADAPVCLLSGCSDVINLNGIGGYGNYIGQPLPKLLPGVAWNIDCLYKSGLLRLWASDHRLRAGTALSSFEIYAVKR